MFKKLIHPIVYLGRLAGLQPKTVLTIIAAFGFTVLMAPTQASAETCLFVAGIGWICW